MATQTFLLVCLISSSIIMFIMHFRGKPEEGTSGRINRRNGNKQEREMKV